MRTDRPTPLLGGLSPAQFMRRHWQKAPLLIRQALPGLVPPVDRAALVALAARDEVESRLVVRDGSEGLEAAPRPLPRRALPAFSRPGWTLLVQGVDLHVDAAHALLQRFRFVPDARLDDLMVSYATDGGGVGPHVDSYDVFLLQLHGTRRWRVGRVADPAPKPGLPLAILAKFEPRHDWLLGPGDMLYLPPGWGHDGIAVGECLTASIGFRSDAARPLAEALLQRLADTPAAVEDAGARYRDPAQPATAQPARLPAAMVDFALDALRRRFASRREVAHALGAYLSEPRPEVVFGRRGGGAGGGVVLDRATRMLYDRGALYVNGEHYHAAGHDARLLRRLADRRRLDAAGVAALGAGARAIVDEWLAAGWLHAGEGLSMDGSAGSIDSRGGFVEAVRALLAEAAAQGGRELLLVDPDFADWPLGEIAVVETLVAWAKPHRRMVLLAASFDEFPRLHPRWVNWRRSYAHVVDCRVNDEQDAGMLPTLLLVDGRFGLKVVDKRHWRGRWSREAADLRRWADEVDALVQRSNPSFPATTLGL